MGRKRKGPWLRKQDNCYYTTIGKELHKLGSADDEWEDIEAAYHALHLKREKRSVWTVAAMADAFLDWCDKHRSPGTYEWYKRYLEEFCASIGTQLKLSSLKAYHVNDWLDKRYGTASNNTRHGAARSVVRLCNWGVKSGYISHSPLIGFEKPSPSARESVVTPDQFKEIISHVPDQQFKDVLLFFWNTGCRPQELRIIEARHVDGRKVILDRKQSKGKRYKRVIYLNDAALEIIQRLAKQNKEGAIFRNIKGRAWTKSAMLCRMKRLRRKTKFDLCVYALRHGYATEMLKAGTDTTTLAQLMGTSQAMIARVYQHVARDEDYMLRAAKDGGKFPVVVVTGLPAAGDTTPIAPG